MLSDPIPLSQNNVCIQSVNNEEFKPYTMSYFHYRCGERITLLNDNCTAIRNDADFDHGIVLSAEPLVNDTLFEIKIEKKIACWSGTLEVGVTDIDPLYFEFPASATRVLTGSWIMSGNSILKNGSLIKEKYGTDLDKLNEGDYVGLMRTSDGELIIYINGEPQGVAAEGLPCLVYALVDLYGKCVQVSIINTPIREHNNDDCLSGSSMLGIENDNLNVTLGGDLSELSLSSSNSLDMRLDMSLSLPSSLPDPSIKPDKLKFHERCGSLIRLSNGNRTAQRLRPLDEFNNGIVLTHRPLLDGELFEIRIDGMVDKWSGSLEMGITAHDPSTIKFPGTMTNMKDGTIMMSGCGILRNGKGIIREYGNYNLDELCEGDRVGMVKKSNGNLHYFINGLDQGVAASRVRGGLWGVVDLYGMACKVSIVERDINEEQNLMLRRGVRDPQEYEPDYNEPLSFHTNCGSLAIIGNNGKTAYRPNAADEFNNAVVLTNRPLKTGEMFEVRLDRVVSKWAGSIEVGVTTHKPTQLDFPYTMTNVKSGTWMMTGTGIMHNGSVVIEHYGTNLDKLQVGDRVGVVRKENGNLHFFVNGVDQGVAATSLPDRMHGVVDLYGQAVEATILDENASPDTLFSSPTLYSDLRFHDVHGKNVKIINSGLTAVRPRPLTEFNDAIVFSNRPLRDGELFEICIDSMVDRWSGSIELGVTAVRPDDINLPNTATDLTHDTWMLSGGSIMENGTTTKNNYCCDLDTLSAGTRLGVMRTADRKLVYYKDGVCQGVACTVPPTYVYVVVDLYGQCAQVSIPFVSPTVQVSCAQDAYTRSDTTVSLQAGVSLNPGCNLDLHKFSEFHNKNVTLREDGRTAVRGRDHNNAIVYSASCLVQDEYFEIAIQSMQLHFGGTLCFGVTTIPPGSSLTTFPADACYITGNELRWKGQSIQQFTPSLNWLRCGDRIGVIQTGDGVIKFFINSEDIFVNTPSLFGCLHVFVELRGSCSGVSVTSRKMPLSPITSIRMQDSLELLAEQELEIPIQLLDDALPNYLFHDIHGRNIELSSEKSVARRVASYNQGIVLVHPAAVLNAKIEVVVEQIDTRWQSSLMIGFVWGSPEKLNLPVTALGFKGNSYVIANDYISINGRKLRSNYGAKLNDLKVGSKVSIQLTENGTVLLSVDGVKDDEILPNVLLSNQPAYAFFDLYGQCQQIKIISNKISCEKADLESIEKERIVLTLPLASSSNNVVATNHSSGATLSDHTVSSCGYRSEIIKFKKTMVLPDDYFLSVDSVCYCINCYKVKNHDCEAFKDESLIGWVRFPLCNLTNIQTDKWHTAYYGCKLGTVRPVLDRRQPLTKDEARWCGLACIDADDAQIVFYASLQHCELTSFRLGDGREVYAAFQLLVKPGAYCVNSDTVEWSTKETGAIVLHSLLLKISSQ